MVAEVQRTGDQLMLERGEAGVSRGVDHSRRAVGEAMIDRVYGGVVPLPPRETRDAYVHETIDHLFGEIWSRNVLNVAQRRLLIIGAVLALGEAGISEVQLRAALAKGELTLVQVEEVLAFMVYYIGYPRASTLQTVVRRLLAEASAKPPPTFEADARSVEPGL